MPPNGARLPLVYEPDARRRCAAQMVEHRESYFLKITPMRRSIDAWINVRTNVFVLYSMYV